MRFLAFLLRPVILAIFTVKWMLGRGYAAHTLKGERRAVCLDCDHCAFSKVTANLHCMKCGCDIWGKTAIKNERCPQGFW